MKLTLDMLTTNGEKALWYRLEAEAAHKRVSERLEDMRELARRRIATRHLKTSIETMLNQDVKIDPEIKLHSGDRDFFANMAKMYAVLHIADQNTEIISLLKNLTESR